MTTLAGGKRGKGLRRYPKRGKCPQFDVNEGKRRLDLEAERLRRRQRAREVLRKARGRHRDALLTDATVEGLGITHSTYQKRMSFDRERDPFNTAEAIVVANCHRLEGSDREQLILALSGAAEPGGEGAISGLTLHQVEREIANVRATSQAPSAPAVRGKVARRAPPAPRLLATAAALVILAALVVVARLLAVSAPPTTDQFTTAIDALRASEGRSIRALAALVFEKEVIVSGSTPDRAAKSTYVSPQPGDELVFRLLVRNPTAGSVIHDARLRDRLSQTTGLVQDESALLARETRRSALTLVNLPDGYRLAYVPNSTRVYAFNDSAGTVIPDVNGISPLLAGTAPIGDLPSDDPQGPEGNASRWYVYRARLVVASTPTTEPAPRLAAALSVAVLNRNTPFAESQRPAAGDVAIVKLRLNQETAGAIARNVVVSGSLSLEGDQADISVRVRSQGSPEQTVRTRVILPPQTIISYVPRSTAAMDHYAQAVRVSDFAVSRWPLESPQGLRIADIGEPLDDERFVTFQFVVALLPNAAVPQLQLGQIRLAVDVTNVTAGGSYGRQVTIQPGDRLRFRIGVTDVGPQELNDVRVRARIGGSPAQVNVSAESETLFSSTAILLGDGTPLVFGYVPGSTKAQLGDGPLTAHPDFGASGPLLDEQGIRTWLSPNGLELRFFFDVVVGRQDQ